VAARQGREALGRAAAAPAAGEEVEERGMGAEHGAEGYRGSPGAIGRMTTRGRASCGRGESGGCGEG